MLLKREDRKEYNVEDALTLLEHKNLKGKKNKYLGEFKKFIYKMENVPSVNIMGKTRLITNLQRKFNILDEFDVIDGMKIANINSYEVQKALNEKKGINSEEEEQIKEDLEKILQRIEKSKKD